MFIYLFQLPTHLVTLMRFSLLICDSEKGKARLNAVASKNVKVLVVGNPCNTKYVHGPLPFGCRNNEQYPFTIGAFG
jgi:hypothetical protein